MRSSRALLLFVVLLALLTACDKQKDPVQVVRSFMDAVEAADINKTKSLVCQAQRDKVQKSLEPFSVTNELDETFEIELEDLVFQEQHNDGEIAVVHVSGKLSISFLGQQEIQEINEEHILIKEGGRWRVCDP